MRNLVPISSYLFYRYPDIKKVRCPGNEVDKCDNYIPHRSSSNYSYNRGNKLSGQMRKTALCLTPQAI